MPWMRSMQLTTRHFVPKQFCVRLEHRIYLNASNAFSMDQKHAFNDSTSTHVLRSRVME